MGNLTTSASIVLSYAPSKVYEPHLQSPELAPRRGLGWCLLVLRDKAPLVPGDSWTEDLMTNSPFPPHLPMTNYVFNLKVITATSPIEFHVQHILDFSPEIVLGLEGEKAEGGEAAEEAKKSDQGGKGRESRESEESEESEEKEEDILEEAVLGLRFELRELKYGGTELTMSWELEVPWRETLPEDLLLVFARCDWLGSWLAEMGRNLEGFYSEGGWM